MHVYHSKDTIVMMCSWTKGDMMKSVSVMWWFAKSGPILTGFKSSGSWSVVNAEVQVMAHLHKVAFYDNDFDLEYPCLHGDSIRID